MRNVTAVNNSAEASAREAVRVILRKRARESLDGALSTNNSTNPTR